MRFYVNATIKKNMANAIFLLMRIFANANFFQVPKVALGKNPL